MSAETSGAPRGRIARTRLPVEFDRLIAIGRGDLPQGERGGGAVPAPGDEEVEPVEVEPGVAVQEQKIVAQPIARMDERPARPEPGRLDRQIDAAGKAASRSRCSVRKASTASLLWPASRRTRRSRDVGPRR